MTYDEPARGFGSLYLFGAILAVGFGFDLLLGGAVTHLPGWIIATVLLLGIDWLVVHAARSTRSLRVTADEVWVGDEVIDRGEIVGVAVGVDPELPVLGWETGMPRGMKGLTVRRTDDRDLVIPTRFPDRLTTALGVRVIDDRPVDEIRIADDADRATVLEIDRRAEVIFSVAGFPLPPGPWPPLPDSPAELALFVIGTPAVGFVQLEEADGLAYVAEMAVLPGSMRRGLGGRLLEHACAWAHSQGYPAVQLTTYADIVWNGPFYARHGFVEVADSLTPTLVRIRAREADVGLDAVARRIVMRRALT